MESQFNGFKLQPPLLAIRFNQILLSRSNIFPHIMSNILQCNCSGILHQYVHTILILHWLDDNGHKSKQLHKSLLFYCGGKIIKHQNLIIIYFDQFQLLFLSLNIVILYKNSHKGQINLHWNASAMVNIRFDCEFWFEMVYFTQSRQEKCICNRVNRG